MDVQNRVSGLEQRVTKIEERNKRVEGDKVWETSAVRKVFIAILTYFVVYLFLLSNQNPDPFKNALVTTVGFMLSTLSLSVLQNLWKKYKDGADN